MKLLPIYNIKFQIIYTSEYTLLLLFSSQMVYLSKKSEWATTILVEEIYPNTSPQKYKEQMVCWCLPISPFTTFLNQ